MLESLSAPPRRTLRARNRICVFSRVWSVEETSWRVLDAQKGPTQKFLILSLSLARNESVHPLVRPRLHPFSRLYIVTIHRSYNPADLPDGSRAQVMKTFL